MSEPVAPPCVIIIGGGLAGLTAGLRLAENGTRVVVLESEAHLGGRARTIEVAGEPVDRGFQSLFTAYPATARLLRDVGIAKTDLVAFDRGAVVHDGGGWSKMGASPLGALGFRWFGRADVARLARLGSEVAAAPVDALLWGDERGMRTDEYLRQRGFSADALEGFFRPLFGVITADPALASDAGYFRFLLKMMLRGRAVIPVEGHGMIASWTAARVRQLGGDVRTGCAVADLITAPDDRGRATGVRMTDGTVLHADVVIVACGVEPARRLLAELDRQTARALDLRPRGVTTLAYRLRSSFHTGRTIVLNAAPRADAGPRIDLVCQESNLLRPGMGEGARLLATSVHGEAGAPDPEALDREMGRVATTWNPGYPWHRMATLEDVIVHPWAQFAVPPGVRDDLPDAATGLANVFLAGDFTAHPSIEGAVGSGERAAEVAAMAAERAVASGDH